ncbi:MAG: glycoside hydrolase family 1 protein [Cyclobacteriaceae bacterium]|jgi:beta-glucosidase|nr:glycoside hydrolase family 1 protein [Cyclobacteriaceae bacterium]
MKLQFPKHFRFGTSTSAVQIETAIDHDWQGFTARDNFIFARTTDHELCWEKDVEIISSLAPNYRMSFMWSRLQRAPLVSLDPDSVNHYRSLLIQLKQRGVDIMLVLHHFANPVWFSDRGGWANKQSVDWWLDYVKKVIHEFGEFVTLWNTFNEPNLYISLSSLAGLFPPQKANPIYAWRVLNNISDAHQRAYEILNALSPGKPVGISHNASILEGDNLLGILPAKITDWWYMHFIPGWFEHCDFFGLSYYSRIGYDPFPVTFLNTPEKIIKKGKLHDDIWEYYPEGLGTCIDRYWKRFRKPIIITENGMSTNDDSQRIKSIYNYLNIIHDRIEKGIDIRGYYHWSTWDNFEWNLGPSYRFGLYSCDPRTKVRVKRPSADVYSSLAHSRKLVIPYLKNP